MAEVTQLGPGVQNTRAMAASTPVDISQNERDARIGNDDSLFQGNCDSDDLSATRTRRDAVIPPLSQRDTRTAVAALWNVFQESRTALGLPDKGRKYNDLKRDVERFLERPGRTVTGRDDLMQAKNLFGKLARGLKHHERKDGENVKNFRRAVDTALGLEWQFKASADECIKRKLDRALSDRLADMKPGATTAFRVKGGAGVDVVPGVGVNASVTHDSNLSITPTEWLVDATGKKLTLSAGADVIDFIETELSLSASSSRAEIYGSLSDYVASESHKYRTWIRHGPVALIARIRHLFMISSSYESGRARADFSRDCLEDHLVELCGMSIDIQRHGPTTRPVERHDTLAGEVKGKAAADFGVTAGVSAAGRRMVTVKRARHDILTIADMRPAWARQLLADKPLVCSPLTLLEAIRSHLKTSSAEITAELMAKKRGNALRDMEERAQFLLEQFALLKLDGDLHPEIEAVLMDLFRDRERILRPQSLATHELSCRQTKWEAELAAVAGVPLVFPNGVNATVTYEHVTEDEDPYYRGHFLNVEVAGIVAVAGAVAGALDAVGVSAGGQWGVAEIRTALAALGFDYSAGVMTSMRFKLKEDGVALMHSVRGITTSTLGFDRKLPTPVSVLAGLAWNSNTADKLTIGSECLDLLAPMMRMRYANPQFGGEDWWREFSTLHKAELDEMYFRIADAVPHSTLEADLERVVREVPATRPLLNALRNAAAQFSDETTPRNRAATNDAMAAFMLAYVEGGYGDEVGAKWQPTVGAKRSAQPAPSGPPAAPAAPAPPVEEALAA
ncbi:hypothetical protein AB870_12345 [Pandoraea faecigallinarum]|uniref:Uncharacterized protein n=1 Tax=Pandoraea faecigallinarum TaxID=656179 RepID=A0A0H3WVU2_9BURK|nr:hypothetical protein [Pandoraea faecigallinarum]AKM30728.1 hypothetical protein AB870_12345 [Pandoraea faecigallinarum]